MPKYKINEGVIDGFLKMVANAAIKKKDKMIQKKLQFDPELKRLVAKEQEAIQKLRKYLEKQKKDNPELDATYDYFKSIGV
tara:strand:+ start:588 stop:830 length:243 start_codon:yes stop_codon:yes gene_type:complete